MFFSFRLASQSIPEPPVCENVSSEPALTPKMSCWELTVVEVLAASAPVEEALVAELQNMTR